VSSDSDFTRLASRVREQGKYVIGIGEKKTPTSFVNACNEFLHIEPARQERERERGDARRSTGKEKQNRTEVLLERAVDQLADSSGWVMLSKLMQYISR
jgi:hypothetical protein